MTHYSRPIHPEPAAQSTTQFPSSQQPANAPTQPTATPIQQPQQTDTSVQQPTTLPPPLTATQPPTSTNPPASFSASSLPPAPSPPTPVTNPPPSSVRTALLSCDAVAFDVDSTVLTEEGIDVLAAHLGKGAEVAALTAAAMGGGMLFQDALRLRLDLLRPSASDIASCLTSHPLTLTPGFLSLLHLLRSQRKQIFLVTGGFSQMLNHLLPRLHIPPTNVYANRLLFTPPPASLYAGFDPSQPTSSTGGKARAIAAIMAERGVGKVVMVGDGMTDVEARPPAVCMVGYGGVVVREAVRKKADWFVTDWRELMDVFESEDERREREKRMRREEEDEQRAAAQVAAEARQHNGASDSSVKKETPSTAAPTPAATARPTSKTEAASSSTAAGIGSAKKPRKERSDKGVKRGKRKSAGAADGQLLERQQHVQRMSKEQRMAEAAKATSAIDAAMAEWTSLSFLSPH